LFSFFPAGKVLRAIRLFSFSFVFPFPFLGLSFTGSMGTRGDDVQRKTRRKARASLAIVGDKKETKRTKIYSSTACFLRMMSYDAWIVYPYCFFAPSGFPGFSLPAPVLVPQGTVSVWNEIFLGFLTKAARSLAWRTAPLHQVISHFPAG